MFRPAFLSLALVFLAGAAAAADYVVVASTDPAAPRGLQLTQGQRLALAPGKTVTVIHASGSVTVLKGQAGGVVVPGGKSPSVAESDRMQVLRLMVSATPAAGTSRFGRSRSMCAPSMTLVTLDAIAEAGKAGCKAEAAEALDAYVAAHAES